MTTKLGTEETMTEDDRIFGIGGLQPKAPEVSMS